MMTKKPLAYRLRPSTFDDIVGQPHLVGETGVIRRMLDNNALVSMILYGPPGIGKTTIATVIGRIYGLSTFTFNASTDKKAQLKEIIQGSINYQALLIVDEIHRMNKDIQDTLLPHVEKGNIIMIGLTTNNPYHSVNPAIRSRAHVFKLQPIEKEDLKPYISRIITSNEEITWSASGAVLDYIVQASNQDIRTAINMIELLEMVYPKENITLKQAENAIQRPSLALDKNEDNYFNILSALQKSIRGSDVDAALHYAARLVVMEDLDSLLRRLTVIAYEDIGLANPGIVTRMDACTRACERVGFPEARIPIGMMVIDLALSPKSNSAEASIDQAINDVKQGMTPKIPNHLINVANFEDKGAGYKYPHDYDQALVKQQYLPQALEHKKYYQSKETGKYERALLKRYESIIQFLRK